MKVMPIGLGHLFFEGENMYKKIDLVSIVTHTIANWSAKKDGTKAFLKLHLNHYQNMFFQTHHYSPRFVSLTHILKDNLYYFM